ncbi:MAG TPA: sigma 54-interacting transcriptional regulator [Myxococcota bacterium]|nr:sigma 54-interacting transcriptional regulator [Myxococcota bacterium]
MEPKFLADDDVSRACLRALSTLICRDGRCLCVDPAAGRVLDLAGDAVMVVDARRRIIYFNERACELTGNTLEDVLGLTCTEGIRCTNCSTGCSLFVEGGICNRRLEIETREGRRVVVVKDGRLLRDDAGNIVGGIETLHDVTDLEKERSAAPNPGLHLHDRCLMFEAFAGDMEDGLALVDGDGRVQCLSSRAAHLLGVSPDQAQGRALVDLAWGGVPDLDRTLAAVRNTGIAAVVEDVRPRASLAGHLGPLVLRLAPQSGDGEAPGSVICTLHRQATYGGDNFFGIVCRSKAMKAVVRAASALAQRDITVLLNGESGTGKEIVARALHLAGPRATRPFHAFNCASLSEELLESELFGHQRGAFTGAVRDKPGRMELCQDGTLLLDEVGCLPLRIQAKLLRVLETREFERVGGTRTLRLRARILAATNSDLAAMVRAGAFREDLYYRLRVVPLEIPPLRDRREDVMPLARHFASLYRDRCGPEGPAVTFTAAAVVALESYAWPGNVRELRNAVQHALALGDGTTIRIEDLPPELRVSANAEGLADPERGRIEDALHRSRYDRAEAARLLGISRTTLWRRMRRLGLDV